MDMTYKKQTLIVSIFSVIVLALVATYAFFTSSVSSSPGALSASTASFSLSLEVTPVYSYDKLIPMDDNLAFTGYNNGCIDDNNFEVCQAYNIRISNTAGTGQHERLAGVINFELSSLKNLSFMVLDGDTIYQDVTYITSGTNLSLGDYVELDDGSSKDLTLVIWLSNIADKNQIPEDGSGTFTAAITYISVRGEDMSSMITGVIK